MNSVVDKIWLHLLENPLNAVGLMNSAELRFGVFTLGSYSLMRIFKPEGLYKSDGEARKFKLTNPLDEDSVIVTDIAASALIGLLSVLII